MAGKKGSILGFPQRAEKVPRSRKGKRGVCRQALARKKKIDAKKNRVEGIKKKSSKAKSPGTK